MKTVILSSALVLASFAVSAVHSQVPIPSREVGFVYGTGQADALVHLDVFMDLMCPDSKDAFPTLLQVAETYNAQTLRLTMHLFPLPYHRVAFYAAKGAHVMQNLAEDTNLNITYEWFDLMFNNIVCLNNQATHNLSDAEVVGNLTGLCNELLPGACDNFQNMIVESGQVEWDTRVAWKYACTRGVAATPTFMVNDIVVAQATATWSLDDWKKIIDHLVD